MIVIKTFRGIALALWTLHLPQEQEDPGSNPARE
jgi:hypothetical protein